MVPASQTRRLPGAVLFACGQNAVRSPMAAALMRQQMGRRVYVASAGVRQGELNHLAVEVMAEIGIDIAGHQPQTFKDLHDTSFDLVISLAPEAHHHAVEMTRTMAIEAEYWPTPDPTAALGNREQQLQAFRAVRDDLRQRIREHFAESAPPNP
ncbi:MAG: arsenate reductase ArsC [Rhizobiales bacterium]|nr:arsenate reductase ArsC [Hyphomicrobiales bacterium]